MGLLKSSLLSGHESAYEQLVWESSAPYRPRVYAVEMSDTDKHDCFCLRVATFLRAVASGQLG